MWVGATVLAATGLGRRWRSTSAPATANAARQCPSNATGPRHRQPVEAPVAAAAGPEILSKPTIAPSGMPRWAAATIAYTFGGSGTRESCRAPIDVGCRRRGDECIILPLPRRVRRVVVFAERHRQSDAALLLLSFSRRVLRQSGSGWLRGLRTAGSTLCRGPDLWWLWLRRRRAAGGSGGAGPADLRGLSILARWRLPRPARLLIAAID